MSKPGWLLMLASLIAVASASSSAKPKTPVFLGDRTVNSLIQAARAGDLPAHKVLRVWHDATRNIYVGVDPSSGWTKSEVAALWQAVQKLENDFPQLFDALFRASNAGGPEFLTHPKAGSWTNRNNTSAFIVVAEAFQPPSKPSMAANFYSLGPPGPGSVYENVPFIGLNPRAINNQIPGYGPALVYSDRNVKAARAAYFAEGLADSILHERIHAFISQFFGHDKLFAELRPAGDQPTCEYNLEELLVKRFLMDLYSTKPGAFSPQFFKYWRSDTNTLFNSVRTSACYSRISNQGLLNGPLVKLN